MFKSSLLLCLFPVLMLFVPSEIYPEKRLSVRSYSPVTIHSSKIAEDRGIYKSCIIDGDFRNSTCQGIWIVVSSPADIVKKGDILFRGKGIVRFEYKRVKEAQQVYRSIEINERGGEGLAGIYLQPEGKVRIKEFGFTVMKYPGAVRIITAKNLKVNGGISLDKWIAGLGKGENAFDENISLSTEELKTVQAEGAKNWIYILGKGN